MVTDLPKDRPDFGKTLLRSLRNTGVFVVCQDLDLRIVWVENLPALWPQDDWTGKLDVDLFPNGEAKRVSEAKRRVVETGSPARLEVSIPTSDGSRWFDLWIDLDRDPARKLTGVVTTAVEVTEHKRREQTLRVLLREVSHRSKNLLAIIQSIAAQTARHSGTIETFIARFRGRVQSLASSQDLVTSSNWRGADLHDLALGQISRYSQDPKHAMRFEGERPYLNPNAAMHVGLALHELVVNSVSFGALARPLGFVSVISELVSMRGTSLSLCWRETVGLAAAAQTRQKRFGSVALERIVPAALNGTANLTFADGKLEYRLIIPPGNFEVD